MPTSSRIAGIPLYASRDFADERGCHTPRWAAALFSADRESSCTREEFSERLLSLEFASAMGPRGTVKADDSEPAPETIDALWQFFAGEADTMTGDMFIKKLQDISPDENREGVAGEGPDGACATLAPVWHARGRM